MDLPQLESSSSDRPGVVGRLASSILVVKVEHPVRVAIDGVDAAGKTTLADELVAPLARSGREVIRASIDGFHRPRVERLRLGAESPAGYYLDSFNYEGLWASLLEPLGPGGSRLYRSGVFDFRSDRAHQSPELAAAADAVLVFDGVFLLRPELNHAWDFRVFVYVDFEETLRRATIRDQTLFGPPQAVLARYRRRYIPGQRMYLETVRPQSLADVVIDNSDPARPVVTRPAWDGDRSDS